MAAVASPEIHDAALGLTWMSAGAGRGLLRLLGQHGAPAVWSAGRRTLEQWGVSDVVAARFVDNRKQVSVERAREAVAAAGLRFVGFGMPDYPAEFAHLSLPPAGFFVRGRDEALRRLLAAPRVTVVGTRRATSYGARAAEGFAAAFAAADIVVVSGMAMGIDTRAHKACLAVAGMTVAVLGCGADLAYPRTNRWLCDKIAETGLVLSELPPGAPPAPWTFPHRNRLLAALGDAVLVVEGSITSGALQTAAAALELGRPVFAVPGSIFSDGYRGCNRLLQDGAAPALEPGATVEEFLQQTRIERGSRQVAADHRSAVQGNNQLCLMQPLAPRHEFVWAALASGPSTVDALVERGGLTVRELMAALAELELAGLVQRADAGVYARAP
jgi:DNA processing protein